MRDVMTREAREVVSDGGISNGSFSILANGKAFRILIDGLYADKPRAIVRELWTNAFDSHNEAGKGDTPFECHLPTRFDPVFSVRDFGTSLEHSDIMGLYTTVFKSTKEDSNVGVGKFGLGSKTPFAYSDQFTVTAWKNGRKRIYNAFINENEIPSISLFHEEDSDEPTGFEVSFAVKPADISAFIRAAEVTMFGFDVKPIMKGADVEESKHGKVIRQGDFWRIYSTGNRYDKPFAASIRQGCVIYPLDRGALATAFQSNHLDLSFLEMPVIIDVPVGSVEITPSRESLQYDAKTIENIIKRVHTIAEEVVSDYVKAINFPIRKSLVDFLDNYNTIINQIDNTLPNMFRNKISGMAIWRGKPFFKINQNRSAVSLNGINVIHCENGYRSRIPGRWRDESTLKAINVDVGSAMKDGNGYTIIRQNKDEKVTYAGARIRAFMEKSRHGYGKVLWFMGTDAQLKRLYCKLYRPKNFKILQLSDLDRPNYAMMPTDTAKEKGTIWVKTFTLNDPIAKECRVPEKGGGIYFSVVGQQWSGCGVEVMDEDEATKDSVSHLTREPDWWIARLHAAAKLGIVDLDTPFYLVPRRSRRAVSRFEMSSDSGWQAIISYLKDAICDSVSEERVKNFLSYQEKSHLRRDIPGYINELLSGRSKFTLNNPNTSILYETFQYFDSLNQALDTDKSSNDKDFVNLGIDLKIYSPDLDAIRAEKADEYEKFKAILKKFELTYPMIMKISRYGFSNDKDNWRLAVDYIQMVDHYASLISKVNSQEEASEFPEE